MSTQEKNTSQDLISRLFDVGAHFGYSRSRRHPSALPYLFGAKNRVEVFDLEKTAPLLESAKAFFQTLGAEGKTVLFVGGKHEARATLKEGAQKIGMPFVAGRWLGGTLTNFPQIKKRIERLAELSDAREKGELSRYTKLERLLIDREIDSLEASFGGLASLKATPAALFIVDTKREHIPLREAKKMRIPVVALVNSDCDVKEIDYPVFGNDASAKSIRFFIEELVKAYEEGARVRVAAKEEAGA